jgi:hypothetical protein
MLHRALFLLAASAAVLAAQDDTARRLWSRPGG